MISNFTQRAVRIATIRSTGTNQKGTSYVAGSYAIRGAKGEPDSFQNFIASGKAAKGFAKAANAVGSLMLVSGIEEMKSYTTKDGASAQALDATLTFSAFVPAKVKAAA